MSEGVVRLMTSEPKECERKSVERKASPTPSTKERKVVRAERARSELSDITTPSESERIGERMGAISMLPMTTAVLSRASPKVAMSTERPIKRKKDDRGADSWIRSLTAFDLSSSVRSLKRDVIGNGKVRKIVFICSISYKVAFCHDTKDHFWTACDRSDESDNREKMRYHGCQCVVFIPVPLCQKPLWRELIRE